MQLIPENIHLTAALEVLASLAATLPPNKRNGRQITRGQLVAVLARHPGLRRSQPAHGSFTEAVTFFGGSYTIFTAGTDDLGVVLQQTLQALFLADEPLDDEQFLHDARDLLWACLLLSHELARRAGIRRNMPPPPETREKRAVFPDAAALRQTVVFDEEELHRVLAPAGVTPEVLDRLTITQGEASLRKLADGQDELYLRPLVWAGNKRVVALPGQLLNAARHAVQGLAIERGHRNWLARQLHQAAASSVVRSLTRLGAQPLEWPVPDAFDCGLCSEFLFLLDTDKVAYAKLVTDSLEGFDPTKLFTDWTLASTPDRVTERLSDVVQHLCQAEGAPNDVLCLLVMQGPLGWSDRNYAPSLPQGLPGVVLSSHELDTIAWLELGEPLALWHFACNAARVRERGPVGHRALLDECAWSKRVEHGDYAPLQEHEELWLMPPGGGARLRGEVLQRWDPHGAPFGDPNSGIEVMRAGREGSGIYAPCDLSHPVARLVEGLPVPFWIVGSIHGDDRDARLRDLYGMITNAIAFWMDELRPDLQPILAGAMAARSVITVQVALLPENGWFDTPENTVPEHPPFGLIVEPAENLVRLLLKAEGRALFFGPDNLGERVLVEVVLAGLRQLLPADRGERLSPGAIEALLDRYAPVGPKKAVSLLNVAKSPALDPRGIPHYRSVQLRDEVNVKADIGRYAMEVLQVLPGVMPAEQRYQFMRHVYEFLLQQLAQAVATLAPDGLLEWLMGHCEAIARTQEQMYVSTPSRLLTGDDRADEEEAVREESSELSRTSVACRFLIEYVAAQPPQGLRPISYSVYDHLLALAAQLREWGEHWDLLHFRLATPEVEVHPLGRVAVRAESFQQVQRRYYTVISRHALSDMEGAFAEHWEPLPEIDLNPNHLSFAQEVGEQLDDMMWLMARILRIGDDITPGVVSMPLEELVERLKSLLPWEESRIRQRLGELSLVPRSCFLAPAQEVWPWRSHRALSYLRRPLVQRVRNGITEVLWGSRHITPLSRYWWRCFQTQRLKDMDVQTTGLMGRAAAKVGLAFEKEVEAFLAKGFPDLQVHRGFHKVGELDMEKIKGVGDVDVLAVDLDKRRILAMECKRLARVTSPHELRRELDGLFDGETSRVRRHQGRMRWLRERWPLVLKELGLDETLDWELVPLMVVDAELFAPHFQEPPFPIVALRDLGGWLQAQGASS